LVERDAPDRVPAECRHRVGEVDARARPGAIELLERQPPAERVEPDGERRAPEVRLGEREDDVAADGTRVDVRDAALAASEERVLLDAGVEEQAVPRAETRSGAERAGLC